MQHYQSLPLSTPSSNLSITPSTEFINLHLQPPFSLPASPASTSMTSGTSTQQTKHSPLSSGMSRIFASIFTYDSSTNPASLPSKTINKFISSQSTSFYRISSIVVSPALLPFTHSILQQILHSSFTHYQVFSMHYILNHRTFPTKRPLFIVSAVWETTHIAFQDVLVCPHHPTRYRYPIPRKGHCA